MSAGKWRIDQEGVGRLLETVSNVATELQESIQPDRLNSVFEGLTWGAAITDCVPAAVSEAMGSQGKRLNSIMACISAGVQGLAGATISYVTKDYDMCGLFQENASSAAATGNFDWLDENGQI